MTGPYTVQLVRPSGAVWQEGEYRVTGPEIDPDDWSHWGGPEFTAREADLFNRIYAAGAAGRTA